MGRFAIQFYRPAHADKEDVLSFLLALNAPPNAAPGFGLGEYIFTAWRDLTPPITETLVLARDQDGAIVALAWLEPPNELAFSIAPQVAGTEIEQTLYRDLLAFTVPRFATLAPDRTEPIGITIEQGDVTAAGCLVDLGLVTEGVVRHHTYRWLEGEPIDRTPASAGYRFVTMEDDSHISERVDLHLAVWPEATIDTGRYRQLRSAPYYGPDLDLCLEASDGRLCAFLIAWFDPVGRSCQFEPIGVHPEYRGRGLGKALVQEAVQRVRAFGANRIYINCYAGNVAGNALYSASGFTLAGRWQWWHFPEGQT